MSLLPLLRLELLRQRRKPMVMLSLALLGLFVLLQFLFTQAWILHNRRISAPSRDRRKQRTVAPAVPSHDFLGRRLSTWPLQSDLTRAPYVVVRVDAEEKRFEAGLYLDSAQSGGTRR